MGTRPPCSADERTVRSPFKLGRYGSPESSNLQSACRLLPLQFYYLPDLHLLGRGDDRVAPRTAARRARAIRAWRRRLRGAARGQRERGGKGEVSRGVGAEEHGEVPSVFGSLPPHVRRARRNKEGAELVLHHCSAARGGSALPPPHVTPSCTSPSAWSLRSSHP